MKWEVKPLGDVCEFQRGLTYAKGDKVAFSNNVVLRANNIDLATNLLDFGELRYISDKVQVPTSKQVKKGSLLICTASGSKTHLGKIAFIDGDYAYAFGGFMGMITPLKQIAPRYLFHLMTSAAYKDFIDALSDGANINNLKFDDLKRFPVPLPPLSEQQRIVGILDEALAGIATAKANAEKNIRSAHELFKSCLASSLADPQQHWPIQTLEDTVADDCTLSYGIVQPGDDVPDGLPVVRPIDLTTRLIGANGLKRIDPKRASSYKRTTLAGGELLLCVRGSTGAMAVASPALKGANVTRGIVPIRFKQNLLDPEFGYYLFRSEKVQDQIAAGTYGAALMQINIRDLRKLKVSLPSLRDQRALVERLTEAEAGSERLESLYQQKLAAVDELKKSLLHQAFTGKLTHDEPATIVETKPETPYPAEVPGISTTDLHAGILAMAYQMHEVRGNVQVFGHVKAEKIADVIERYLGIALGRNPVKDRFGPNDFNHLKKVEHRARMTNAFDFQRVEDGPYRVKKLHGFNRLVSNVRGALGDRLADVEALVALMLPMDTTQAEVFATVYAAWNNLLIEGKTPTDEEIVHESRENWHPEKLKIPRERFFGAVKFLRDKAMIPHGKGSKVTARGG